MFRGEKFQIALALLTIKARAFFLENGCFNTFLVMFDIDGLIGRCMAEIYG